MGNRILHATWALWLSVITAGCLHVDTPKGFVELEGDGERRYLATSATGVVLSIRTEASLVDGGGDLDFWGEAIERRVARLGGYALLDARELKTRTGLPCKQLRFGHDRDRRPYLYWVTLVLDGDDLHVVEAGGPKAQFAELEQGLQDAIASLR